VLVFIRFSFAQESSDRVYFGPKAAMIGEDFPDTFLQDTLKQYHRISDYLDGERYLLLDFWQLNCGPCIKALPELRELHEKHNDIIRVISINTDEHLYTFKVSTRVKDITWISLWDDMGWKGLMERYGYTSVPYFVLISPKGKILKLKLGYSTNDHTTVLREIMLNDILNIASSQ